MGVTSVYLLLCLPSLPALPDLPLPNFSLPLSQPLPRITDSALPHNFLFCPSSLPAALWQWEQAGGGRKEVLLPGSGGGGVGPRLVTVTGWPSCHPSLTLAALPYPICDRMASGNGVASVAWRREAAMPAGSGSGSWQWRQAGRQACLASFTWLTLTTYLPPYPSPLPACLA